MFGYGTNALLTLCPLPIGNYQCRLIEKLVQVLLWQQVSPLEEMQFCSPASDCNYTGVYKDLYCHYHANHRDTWDQRDGPLDAELFYHLFYSYGVKTMSFGLGEMDSIQKASFQTPSRASSVLLTISWISGRIEDENLYPPAWRRTGTRS
ncbi:hypothetical protein IGI04_006111 [Brassica rapa subsp. trilocularis]|uniref:Uncharacterized protein n=1 Tax=Brassica rapa subsp. trilocularis TaxID=1813537 RepID=A0ABQ7NFX9_BRACM|nr:hypothetical protein IGI04_006111 [Brassica rapa subsp. trilocularis]